MGIPLPLIPSVKGGKKGVKRKIAAKITEMTIHEHSQMNGTNNHKQTMPHETEIGPLPSPVRRKVKGGGKKSLTKTEKIKNTKPPGPIWQTPLG